jgi:two-component system cell cycle sensor histidine kinase/response regulator CckA
MKKYGVLSAFLLGELAMTHKNLPKPNPPPHNGSEPSINQKLKRLTELFSLLGSDPEQNIRIIVEQASQVLESACALYKCIDKQKDSPVHWSCYNPPPGFPPETGEGDLICDQAGPTADNQPLAIGDLIRVPHLHDHPYVRFGVRSYLGCPVHCKGKRIGLLCILDTRTRDFTPVDTYIVGTLAKSLSLEEERKEAEAALRNSETEHRRLHKKLRLEKQTTLALEESEKRYRDLYNNTPAMLYSLDREDRVTNVSNLWLDIMGYQREEVIGRHALDFLSPQSRRAAREFFPDFHKTGRMKKQACQFATKNGAYLDVMLSAIAQRDAEGRYDGALAFMIDVTPTREAEKDQLRLTARLQQAQKMEAIATLAGGIAHQFNNALAVILGNIELIQMDGMSDPKMARFIEPINQAGQKMVQLTSQLLAYARGGKFQTQVVASHRFVREALSLVSHSMSSYVELKTQLDEATDPIEVDSTQMQMLLAAILSNASEAIEQKGTVTVILHNTNVTLEESRKWPGLKAGRYILLQIKDTGKGMDEQARLRIFEPFFTTKFQGRGLGMAAVYGIVKKHGGFIYVASEPGHGTTVTIYLPCARWYPTAAEPQPVYTPRRSGTALIIEDEDLVMEVNRAIVEKLGYHVLEAQSGKEALDIAATYNGHIDFALLDVILPDMSGNQIYPRLKKLLPYLKVIVCSGFTLDGPAREILNAGAESFLPKPFTVAALSSTLDEILKNEKTV